jgi:hypothetical protein
MSASGSGGRPSGGYNPPRMTLEQFKEYAKFFKDLLAENPVVKYSIVLAGIGGAFEAVHDSWLFFVWLYWKTR